MTAENLIKSDRLREDRFFNGAKQLQSLTATVIRGFAVDVLSGSNGDVHMCIYPFTDTLSFRFQKTGIMSGGAFAYNLAQNTLFQFENITRVHYGV
jgi:hypothetical protein